MGKSNSLINDLNGHRGSFIGVKTWSEPTDHIEVARNVSLDSTG